LINGFTVTTTLSSTMPTSKGITIETTLLDQSTSPNIAQTAAITSTSVANNLQRRLINPIQVTSRNSIKKRVSVFLCP
jgi:hypothetical protein